MKVKIVQLLHCVCHIIYVYSLVKTIVQTPLAKYSFTAYRGK